MASSSRPNKRSKVQLDSNDANISIKVKREGLFAPFRSLGHVSTSVPFIVQSKSSKYLESPAITVITSLGRSWAMWDGSNLKLLFVGELKVHELFFLGHYSVQ